MKKKLFLIAGNFGIGKTSICNYYPHKPSKIHGLELYDQFPLYGVGGPRGTDDLNGMGYNKQAALEKLIWPNKDKHLLVHGVYYQQLVDIPRYNLEHDATFIFLDTDRDTNYHRMVDLRGGKWNEATYLSRLGSMPKLKLACEAAGTEYFSIDNNRPFDEVAPEVWKIIWQRIRKNL